MSFICSSSISQLNGENIEAEPSGKTVQMKHGSLNHQVEKMPMNKHSPIEMLHEQETSFPFVRSLKFGVYLLEQLGLP